MRVCRSNLPLSACRTAGRMNGTITAAGTLCGISMTKYSVRVQSSCVIRHRADLSVIDQVADKKQRR